MLRVNEMFPTIQGEAGYTGTPSVFIRLQGCPVGCSWCDTKHTWGTNPRHEVSIEQMLAKEDNAPTWASMSEQQIISAAQGMAPDCRHFVLTGGEPCTYDLFLLTAGLLCTGSVQVETSGTHEIRVAPGTWVTVSPKIGMGGGLEVRNDALERANEVKMPVANLHDIDNLQQLLDRAGVQKTVWLQPVSQGEEATRLCIEASAVNGWRLSLQTHKYAGLR